MSLRWPRWTAAVAALAFMAWAGQVRADDGGTAQALFDKAVADLEAGHPESSCPAFAESQRLDPRPGTLFALADCEVALDKTASALGHYHEYLGWVSRLPADQQERHADRVAVARSQVEALQSVVPTLTIKLSSTIPAETIVERDGVVLQGAALGVALPTDPGDHVITVQQPGEQARRIAITLGKGDATVVDLENEYKPPPVLPPPVTEPTSGPAPPREPEESTSSQRTWGYVASGIGAAGLLVGAVTGLMAIDRKATVNAECPDNACTDEGMSALDSGRTLATVSTIAFGVGLAGAATGVTLILTAPTETNHGSAWLSVRGSF